jgi:hypothetical protein
MRGRIQEIAQRFREKGATSPERAMSAQELRLPPRFEEAMKRRLGQTGIFVEVGGKYYLNEARLEQLRQQRGPQGGGRGSIRTTMMTLRMARMVIVVILLLTFLTNLFVRNGYVWILVAGLFVILIVLTVMMIYYTSRMRGMRQGFSRADNFGNQSGYFSPQALHI